MKTYSLLLLAFFILSNAIGQTQSIDFLFNSKDGYVSNQSWKVNKGDIVTIRASGEISVGMFAGNRSPDGLDVYNGNRYNILRNKPHCGLMVCVINQANSQKESAYWNWEYVGSCGEYTVPQSGTLVFDLNEAADWRWDNTPVNGGWKISFIVTSPTKGLGKLKDKPVIKIDESIILYDCKTFRKQSDNTWLLTNTDGEIVGICANKAPYVYELKAQNPLSKTRDKNIYLDTKTQKAIFYKGRKHELAPHDGVWYLQGENLQCEGIVSYKNDELHINEETDPIEDLLKHINRNFFNREAKGKLTYLCSKRYKAIFVYRYFVDEAGCIWLQNDKWESGYHPNPNDATQPGLKFTRRDPGNLEAAFESVRIPMASETRDSQIIIGRAYLYKVSADNTELRSNNLMTSPSRGSYNYQSSNFSNTGLNDYSGHSSEDMKLHDSYHDYLIYKEVFGTPSKFETNSRNSAFAIPLRDNERTCPWDDPWR